MFFDFLEYANIKLALNYITVQIKIDLHAHKELNHVSIECTVKLLISLTIYKH